MIKKYTFWCVIFTVALGLLRLEEAHAQTTLNFPRAIQEGDLITGIAVTNTSPYFADVQFAYYGVDGNLITSGFLNPVTSRIPPRGQMAVLSTELFGAAPARGWIQATSPTSGLQGAYFSGDFRTTIEGSLGATALTAQVTPFPRDDNGRSTELVITNSSVQRTSVSVVFYDAQGQEVGASNSDLPPHAQFRIPRAGAWARVSSSAPVVAVSVTQSQDAVAFINGQAIENVTARVIPHFISGSGVDGTVVLVNPTSSLSSVSVKLFADDGVRSANVNVPANGSAIVDARVLTGLLIPPSLSGWLSIESGNTQVNAVAILDSAASLTSMPVQAPFTRFLFARMADSDALYTGVVLINPTNVEAALELSLLSVEGVLLTSRSVTMHPGERLSRLVRELIPENSAQPASLIVRSSQPLYAVQVLGASSGALITSVAPHPISGNFAAVPPPRQPVITSIEPGAEVRPGSQLQVTLENAGPDVTFLLDKQVVPARALSPVASTYFVDVPQGEYGYINLRVRSGGMESTPVTLRVTADNGTLSETLSGMAFYQKIQTTENGLDLSGPVMAPIRRARVEVVDRSLQAVVSVAETDDHGRFRLAVPFESDLTVRVVSQLQGYDLRVADNTNNNALYVLSRDVDMREQPSQLVITDRSRISGAFNILEAIQRGNDLIRIADPRIRPPSVTVFWSVRNTNTFGEVADGAVGTTYFSLTSNTAFVLGDRAVDSDEYDDSVILHEYAHMLAVQFSRDDSPGGSHRVGDILDARVAWSEGFANFFSGAARNDVVYRDSNGPNGISVLRYDLEENVPLGDQPGYWSEASVHSLLWDLIDDRADDGDAVQFPFSSVWAAFTDLRNQRFIYLPYFLENFIERNPGFADAIRNMVVIRAIDFQPSVRPSVTNPFPRHINFGDTVTGEVDSLSPRRSNLMQSSHFFSFTHTGGPVAIRLDIIGLGPGNNPNANDLDLLLWDVNGRVIDRSDRGLNGQSELIPLMLPANTYVIEVRSFYARAGTNTRVFNSGRYRLNLTLQ